MKDYSQRKTAKQSPIKQFKEGKCQFRSESAHISALDCNTNQDHEIFSDYVNVLENIVLYTESDLDLQIINTLYTVKYSRCTCQFFMMTY